MCIFFNERVLEKWVSIDDRCKNLIYMSLVRGSDIRTKRIIIFSKVQ